METQQAQPGFYSSTAGTYFADKDALAEHYKSDFHMYNLKRKVADLPPVTREWFEARKAQLSNAPGVQGQKVWFDPLTRRKFYSENTYQAFVRSKKYKELVKKSNAPAPEPVVSIKKLEDQQPVAATAKQPFNMVVPSGLTEHGSVRQVEQAEQSTDEEADSEWETASDEDMEEVGTERSARRYRLADHGDRVEQKGPDGGDENWEEWDVSRSLFDGHQCASMEANLEYMFKKFGFYFPDSEYLVDPEGLLKYLGEKLQHGGVALYERGDNENAKTFTSLHAVQRHMVDTNQCKMAYDGNEEEYADFYDYSSALMDEDGKELVLAGEGEEGVELGPGGFELVLGAPGGRGKVLGHREFARYYKQNNRVGDLGRMKANAVTAQYRALGAPTAPGGLDAVQRKAQKQMQHKLARLRLRNDMNSNVIRNLPKNVPH